MRELTDEEKQEIDEKYKVISKRSKLTEQFTLLYYEYFHKYHNYGTQGNVYKLSMMEIHTLTLIEETPGVTVTELAELWNKTTSALSQTVTRLEQYGYVEKSRARDDGKLRYLYVTEVGEQLSYAHKQSDIRKAKLKDELLLKEKSRENLDIFYDVMSEYIEVLKNGEIK